MSRWITDEELEKEIEQLKQSPFVKLARKELRLKYAKRQQLYQLRNLEKRGRELDAKGVTYDTLEEWMEEAERIRMECDLMH